uniref:C-type lectin domain-containing protein n=1 Tax=Periophthalmus magnuspinnatus TaxID=409849 RepID=A0A3B4BF38_9GOBI
ILALSALSNGGPRGFHLFRELKTWSEAQTFCRENYVDLATIETEEEWSQVVLMLQNLNIYPWIGLYDDYTSWRWSLDGKYLVQTLTPLRIFGMCWRHFVQLLHNSKTCILNDEFCHDKPKIFIGGDSFSQ